MTPLAGLVLPIATAVVISAPVPPVIPLRVVAPFEAPASRYGAGHRGIDVAADTDQPVASITSGRIGFSGSIAGKAVVTVLIADGRRVTYEPVISELASGTPVRAGQLIGTVAPRGGHCGGSPQPHRSGCLHIGLLRGDEYLDPMTLLRRPAVLKPLNP
jgi:murein DD-endopeptidase MepM/ murein hydrolase activator NlpD